MQKHQQNKYIEMNLFNQTYWSIWQISAVFISFKHLSHQLFTTTQVQVKNPVHIWGPTAAAPEPALRPESEPELALRPEPGLEPALLPESELELHQWTVRSLCSKINNVNCRLIIN